MKNSIKTIATVVLGLSLTASVHAQTDKNSSREELKTKAASIPDKVQTVAGELQFLMEHPQAIRTIWYTTI